MNTKSEMLDAQADQRAEEALRELDCIETSEDALDEVDDYAWQCDYAGCYPWLGDIVIPRLQDTIDALDPPG